MAVIDKLTQIILPKRTPPTGASFTSTYNPRDEKISVPAYRQHLTDLPNTRVASDSRALLNELVNHDPDISAAVHAYLTISGSAPLVIRAYDLKGVLDPKGIDLANRVLEALTVTSDYSVGYSAKPTLSQIINDLKYTALLRGMIATELVFNKQYIPIELRLVDPASLEWREKKPGVFSPIQKAQNDEIDLNIPTFFTSRFHQNPTSPYSYSPFVSAINTIVARQDVINELYRIMQVVGYPRMDISVLETVMFENAPADVRGDLDKQREYVRAEINSISSQIQGLTPRDAFIHSNAVEAQVINDKNPGAGLQIERVIQVLDNQNQAALKVMPAVVGRSSNVNTASTEARLFAMSADALNMVVASLLSQTLTLATRLAGFAGRVEVNFRSVELRPILELEPQLSMRGSRLRQELSLGLISDDEYHLEMFGRPKPPSAPTLSGTNFLSKDQNQISATDISPNGDPLGRGLAPEGSKSAGSNEVKSGEVG